MCVKQIVYSVFYLKINNNYGFSQKIEYGKFYVHLMFNSKFIIYLQNVAKTTINVCIKQIVYNIFYLKINNNYGF
jgi:hypothetical protein